MNLKHGSKMPGKEHRKASRCIFKLSSKSLRKILVILRPRRDIKISNHNDFCIYSPLWLMKLKKFALKLLKLSVSLEEKRGTHRRSSMYEIKIVRNLIFLKFKITIPPTSLFKIISKIFNWIFTKHHTPYENFWPCRRIHIRIMFIKKSLKSCFMSFTKFYKKDYIRVFSQNLIFYSFKIQISFI